MAYARRRRNIVTAALASLVILLAGLPAMAGEAPGPALDRNLPDKPIDSIEDLNGRRLGVIAGTMLDEAINDKLDFTQIVYFDGNAAEIEALMKGEIDAMIDDEPVVRFYAGRNPRLRRVDGHIQNDDYAFATRFTDKVLNRRFNQALKAIIDDGTMADMERRWLDSPDDSTRAVPELFPESAVKVDSPADPVKTRTLKIGVSSVSAPFCYVNDEGVLTGLDIELLHRVCQSMGMEPAIVDMEFSALIPALLDGEVDVIGSCFSITEERHQLIFFTDSYFKGGVAALVLETDPEGDARQDAAWEGIPGVELSPEGADE